MDVGSGWEGWTFPYVGYTINGHQMVLCDELDAAGLLSPRLRNEWVEPMKARVAAAMAPVGAVE